jgi:hypothetical protein
MEYRSNDYKSNTDKNEDFLNLSVKNKFMRKSLKDKLCMTYETYFILCS